MLVYKSETELYRTNSEDGHGSVDFSVIGGTYTKTLSASVRDIGDDIISLTVQQYFYDNTTNEFDDFGCSEYGNIFISREHALEFANIIIETLGK